MHPANRFTACRCIFLLIFYGAIVAFGSFGAAAQRQAADAAEISRDFLYVAPQRIHFLTTGGARTPIFITRTGYAYQVSGGEILPVAAPPGLRNEEEEAPKGKRTISVGGTEYTISPHSDDDRATLSFSKTGAEEPVTVVLWTREQLTSAWLPFLQSHRKSLTAEKLREDLEVGNPVIYDLQADGDSVWVAVGHSMGESELGIGSAVRFDLVGKRAKVYQPREVGACAVTQLAIGGDKAVWLASRRQYEGAILPCAGGMRLDPATGEARVLSSSLTRSGVMVTALGAATDRLWVGSDAGICSVSGRDSWDCRRIVPSVSLKSVTPISNLPGDKPSGNLKPGDYEVRWANTAFLEVVTKDSFDAWIAADDFQEAAARNFDVEPYKLLNISSGGPAPIRLLTKPGGNGVAGALVYRAELERLSSPPAVPSGWVHVRARIGWIERKKLEVVPKMVVPEASTAVQPVKPASRP